MAEEKFIPQAVIKSGSEMQMGRKGFLSWLSLGWLAFAGATGGFFTVMIRFMFPNVLFEPPQSFKIDAGFPKAAAMAGAFIFLFYFQPIRCTSQMRTNCR